MQQGCVYSHDMPDEATLKDIGFPEGFPKWYRDGMNRGNKGSSRHAGNPRGRRRSSKARETNVLTLVPKVTTSRAR